MQMIGETLAQAEVTRVGGTQVPVGPDQNATTI
jgi:hypothetical protein